jgi:hypothetical protein
MLFLLPGAPGAGFVGLLQFYYLTKVNRVDLITGFIFIPPLIISSG